MANKGAIFDMDGVLVDNRDAHIHAFGIFTRRHGFDVTYDELMAIFGTTNEYLMPIILKNPDLSPAQIKAYGDEKEEIYRQVYADTIGPTPGLVPLLKGLKGKGVKLAVGSSGMIENVDFVLDKCGIREFFDVIVNGGMVTKGKPDPEIFSLAAELLELPPHEVVVFEDSFHGIEAARRAGMKVVALSTTFAPDQHTDFDLLIPDFTGLGAQTVVDL